MDSALRQAIRSGDATRVVILSERAGEPTRDGAVWAMAFDTVLALESPEVDVTMAEYLAAVLEAELGSYPCVCGGGPRQVACPTHGADQTDERTRGRRFAEWVTGDAVRSRQGMEHAAFGIARTIRRLVDAS